MSPVALIGLVLLVHTAHGVTLQQQLAQLASREATAAAAGQNVQLSPPTATQAMPRFAQQGVAQSTPSVTEQLADRARVKYCGHNICPHQDGVCCLDMAHCCQAGQRCGVHGSLTTCVSRVPVNDFVEGASGSGSGSFSGSGSYSGSGSSQVSASQERATAQVFADQKLQRESAIASGFGLHADSTSSSSGSSMRFESQRATASASASAAYHTDADTAAEQAKLAQLSTGAQDQVYGEDNNGIEELEAAEMVPEAPAAAPVQADRPTPILQHADGAPSMRFAHVMQAAASAAARRKSDEEDESEDQSQEKKSDDGAVVVMRNSNQLYRGPKVGQQPAAQQTPMVAPAQSSTDVLAAQIAQEANSLQGSQSAEQE